MGQLRSMDLRVRLLAAVDYGMSCRAGGSPFWGCSFNGDPLARTTA